MRLRRAPDRVNIPDVRQGVDLFSEVVVPKEHHAFHDVRLSPFHDQARALINTTFAEMGDPDGNFAVSFQSDGFYARVFELACYRYLSEQSLTVARVDGRPDFMVRGGGVAVALEAVTSNSSYGHLTDVSLRQLEDVPLADILEKCSEEFPIRVGSALYSKLQKRYWELPHCQGLPLVLVVGPFHEAASQMYVDESLARYLYGMDRCSDWTEHNGLLVRATRVDGHSFGGKTIPSNFFGQQDAEHISAVAYCNQFSCMKFFRMAAQEYGVGDLTITVKEAGMADDWRTEWFSYDMGQAEAPKDEWARGVTVFHNPNAALPLPLGALACSSAFHLKSGRLVRELWGFHPLVSWTHVKVPAHLARTPTG